MQLNMHLAKRVI